MKKNKAQKDLEKKAAKAGLAPEQYIEVVEVGKRKQPWLEKDHGKT